MIMIMMILVVVVGVDTRDWHDISLKVLLFGPIHIVVELIVNITFVVVGFVRRLLKSLQGIMSRLQGIIINACCCIAITKSLSSVSVSVRVRILVVDVPK